MAFTTGLITSPTPAVGWSLGNVATPDWANLVSGDVNYFYGALGNGTLSAYGLAVDGVGNQSISPVPAQLAVGQSTLADTPLALFKDQGGNARFIVDHNGLPRGRYGKLEDHWVVPIALGASASGDVTNDVQWKYSTSANAAIGNGSSPQCPPGVSTDYMSAQITITPGTASTNKAVLYSQLSFNISTKLILVVGFDFSLSAVGANAEDWLIGLVSSPTSTLPTTSPQIATGAFRRLSTDANWQTLTADGVSNNVTDTGFAAASSGNFPADYFQIEYHGSATPYGIAAVEGGLANTAKMRFFINGTRRVTTTTNLPPTNTSVNLAFIGNCTGVASAAGKLGPVLATWNRTLAGSSL